MKTRNLATGLWGVLTLALLAAFTAAPAQAQQQPAPQAVPELEEGTLETFAEAYLEIDELRMEMQTRLQAVQDAEQANAIQQEANNEMQRVLEEHEISVQEYQEITQVLNTDPEQRQEFEEILQELQTEQGG